MQRLHRSDPRERHRRGCLSLVRLRPENALDHEGDPQSTRDKAMSQSLRQQTRSRFQQALSALDLLTIAQDPALRLSDVPGGSVLVQHLMSDPQNPQLLRLFRQIVETQESRALISRDPYWPNYPPRGSLPLNGPGRIPLAAMPTGCVLSTPLSSLPCNLLVVGPTGSGKTSLLRAVLAAALLGQEVTIVAFDYKGDLVDCELLTRATAPLLC
jgi:hypothetical protein